VQVISRRALRVFSDTHPEAETPLDAWYRTVRRLRWTSIVDVRQTYPHADAVGEFTIFNIAGNRYRLAAYVSNRTGCVYVRHVISHTSLAGEYGLD